MKVIVINISTILLFGCCVRSTIAGGADHSAICPDVLTRKEWGGRPAESIEYTVFPIDYVIIDHTVTAGCTTKASCSDIVRSIQNYNMDPPNEFGDIGHNFLIGGDGKVYEGRGWHKQGAHTIGYNKISIGVAFIGSFNDVFPSSKQLQAAKDLLQCGVELGELTENYKLYGAKQVRATESPGIKLYSKIKKWPHFSRPDEEER